MLTMRREPVRDLSRRRFLKCTGAGLSTVALADLASRWELMRVTAALSGDIRNLNPNPVAANRASG